MSQPLSHLVMRRPTLDNLEPIPELPEGYRLRDANHNDLDALATTLALAFEDDLWSVARVNRTLISASDVSRTFVVDYGGVAVATASAQTKPERFAGAGLLHWVAVHPAHQGKRLGYVVSLAVLREHKRLCRDAAFLSTDDERLPAIRTYLRLGFRPYLEDDTHPERWERVMQIIR